MNSKQLTKWENLRKLGKWNFVALFSFGTSLLVLPVMVLLHYIVYLLGLTDKLIPNVYYLIYIFLAYCAVDFLVGTEIWNKSEKEFLQNSKNSNE